MPEGDSHAESNEERPVLTLPLVGLDLTMSQLFVLFFLCCLSAVAVVAIVLVYFKMRTRVESGAARSTSDLSGDSYGVGDSGISSYESDAVAKELAKQVGDSPRQSRRARGEGDQNSYYQTPRASGYPVTNDRHTTMTRTTPQSTPRPSNRFTQRQPQCQASATPINIDADHADAVAVAQLASYIEAYEGDVVEVDMQEQEVEASGIKPIVEDSREVDEDDDEDEAEAEGVDLDCAAYGEDHAVQNIEADLDDAAGTHAIMGIDGVVHHGVHERDSTPTDTEDDEKEPPVLKKPVVPRA